MESFNLYHIDFEMSLYKNSNPLSVDQEEDYAVIALGSSILYY